MKTSDSIEKSRASPLLAVGARYAIVGLFGAGVQILSLYMFVDILHAWYLTGTLYALGVAMVVTFTLHKLWTFREPSLHRLAKQSANYILVISFSVLANTALMYLFVDVFGVWYILSQVLSLGITALGSFLGNRHITFRQSP